MWQSEAESDNAPCSPCRIEENDHQTSRLTSLIFPLSSSFSPIAVFRSVFAPGLTRYSFSVSKPCEKSMYLRSSGSQKTLAGDGALTVAVHVQHGGEVGGIDGVIRRVFGDVFHRRPPE